MNHGLTGSRWLKLSNSLPEMQDNLDACLRYLASVTPLPNQIPPLLAARMLQLMYRLARQ